MGSIEGQKSFDLESFKAEFQDAVVAYHDLVVRHFSDSEMPKEKRRGEDTEKRNIIRDLVLDQAPPYGLKADFVLAIHDVISSVFNFSHDREKITEIFKDRQKSYEVVKAQQLCDFLLETITEQSTVQPTTFDFEPFKEEFSSLIPLYSASVHLLSRGSTPQREKRLEEAKIRIYDFIVSFINSGNVPAEAIGELILLIHHQVSSSFGFLSPIIDVKERPISHQDVIFVIEAHRLCDVVLDEIKKLITPEDKDLAESTQTAVEEALETS